MENLKKVFTTVLMLVTILSAHAHSSNIIGLITGQPFEITTVKATPETKNVTLQHIASSENISQLLLKTGDLDQEDLMYMIHNANGLVVKSSRIEKNELAIDLTDLPAATYFFIVSNGDVSITFKVVKNIQSNSELSMIGK